MTLRDLLTSRDRAVRAEQECTRLRCLYERAVDDAARLRLQVKGQADAIAGLEALVADLVAFEEALGVDQLPEVDV